MQGEYYSILFKDLPPYELFQSLYDIMPSLPSKDKSILITHIPTLLSRFPILPYSAILPYLNLIAGIINDLCPQEKLIACFHALTVIPSRLHEEPKWKSMICFFLGYVSSKFELISENPFLSRLFLLAIIRQSSYFFGSLVKSGMDWMNISEKDKAPVRSIIGILELGKIKELPDNIFDKDTTIENWIG